MTTEMISNIGAYGFFNDNDKVAYINVTTDAIKGADRQLDKIEKKNHANKTFLEDYQLHNLRLSIKHTSTWEEAEEYISNLKQDGWEVREL